ncbi:MAG: bifunctional diaminohydroxyphosphoribosylaminopyrimidine deaminase/5-amino-6-(5-phosphoribosylamino)uracil reductase RibD, partial [Chrysiogenales bacterium]
ADMYVTLEPCSHYGKTPPCTAAIIRSGIARVYIPILDPNPRVSGRGVAELKDAGIEVIFTGDMAEYAIDMIRPFKKYILRKHPFIISKSAVTLDGRIAALSGDSRWISSEYSRYLTHRLRARVDAVIIGKNTFLHDNPSLTVRLESFSDNASGFFDREAPRLIGRNNYFLRSLASEQVDDVRQPLRVVIGIPPDIDLTRAIFADDNYLFFERREIADRMIRSNPGFSETLGRINCRLVDAPGPREEIHAILDYLSERGVMMALLEGGGRLAGSFLDANEIDQYFYIITPKIIGNGLPSLSGAGADSIGGALTLKDVSWMPVNDDLIYNGYREPYHFEML